MSLAISYRLSLFALSGQGDSMHINRAINEGVMVSGLGE
jgi:hypothetical protein